MKSAIILVVALVVVGGLVVFLRRGSGAPKVATGALAPGQRWSYRTRAGEPDSTLVILRIDEDPKAGRIVHVRIEGVSFASRNGEGSSISSVGHAPIAEASVLPALGQIVETGCEIDDLEGYFIWKKSFDAGKGGVFTISPAEVVEVIAQASKQPR
jgi:hypothetical protein